MTRWMTCTCGLFADALLFDPTASPLIIGLTSLATAGSAIVWWKDFNRLIDRLVGIDGHDTVDRLD